jgi:hypothetical protein
VSYTRKKKKKKKKRRQWEFPWDLKHQKLTVSGYGAISATNIFYLQIYFSSFKKMEGFRFLLFEAAKRPKGTLPHGMTPSGKDIVADSA